MRVKTAVSQPSGDKLRDAPCMQWPALATVARNAPQPGPADLDEDRHARTHAMVNQATQGR